MKVQYSTVSYDDVCKKREQVQNSLNVEGLWREYLTKGIIDVCKDISFLVLAYNVIYKIIGVKIYKLMYVPGMDFSSVIQITLKWILIMIVVLGIFGKIFFSMANKVIVVDTPKIEKENIKKRFCDETTGLLNKLKLEKEIQSLSIEDVPPDNVFVSDSCVEFVLKNSGNDFVTKKRFDLSKDEYNRIIEEGTWDFSYLDSIWKEKNEILCE